MASTASLQSSFSPFAYFTFVVTLLSLHRVDAEDGGSGLSTLTLTLINNCGDNTLYPGVQGNAVSEHLAGGGFPMGPGNVTVLHIPAGWSGLVWPRTDCDFSKRPSCSAGDCGPRVRCMGAPPRKPVTVARISVDADAAAVAYEIDISEGFELPMKLAARGPGGACPSAGCDMDLMSMCPEEQLIYWPPHGRRRLDDGDEGMKVGCMSLCLDGGGRCEAAEEVKRRCPNLVVNHGDRPLEWTVCGLPAELKVDLCPAPVVDGEGARSYSSV